MAMRQPTAVGFEASDAPAAEAACARHPLAVDRLLPQAGHDRLRRAGRPRRLHATRPGRAPPLDRRRGVQARSGPGADHARTAGGAAGDRHRLLRPRRAGRHARRARLRAAVVPDGARPLRALRRVRRAVVDAGRLLRRLGRGHRHHRHRRLQAGAQGQRPRSAAVGHLRGPVRRHRGGAGGAGGVLPPGRDPGAAGQSAAARGCASRLPFFGVSPPRSLALPVLGRGRRRRRRTSSGRSCSSSPRPARSSSAAAWPSCRSSTRGSCGSSAG